MKAEVTIKYEDGVVVNFKSEDTYHNTNVQEGGDVQTVKTHSSTASGYSVKKELEAITITVNNSHKEEDKVEKGCESCKHADGNCSQKVGLCDGNDKWEPRDES